MSRSGSTDSMLVPGASAYAEFAAGLLARLRGRDGFEVLILEGAALLAELDGWRTDGPPSSATAQTWIDAVMVWSKRAGAALPRATRGAEKR